MREGWTYKRLEDVCSIDYGTRVVQKKDKGTKYYVYGGGGATFMVDSYNREDCIIVSRFAMSPKCTRFVKGKFFLNDSGLSVRTKTSTLSQDFVDKALLANNDTIYSFGKGMAQRNLDMPSFRSLIIPVPPLAEQERIVAELDLLTGIINKQKAQLAELDTLAQSIFYDMFGDIQVNNKGWRIVKLDDICEITSSRRIYQSEQSMEGIPFYRISDLSKLIKEEPFEAELHIPTSRYNELLSDGQVPVEGDILITSRGTLGTCYIIKSTDCFYFQDGMISWLKNISSDFTPVFISHLFKDEYIQAQISSFQSGTTVAYLSLGMLKKFFVPQPPLGLQQSFAQKIQSIESQKATINRSIAETQKLFDYTMDKYFG